jgi:hypothetical protein
MYLLSRTGGRVGVGVLAVAMLSLLPGKATAQFNTFNPFNPFPPVVPFPVPVNPNAIGNQGGGVTRATSSLANPINFYQYGQITGVGPTTGTVRIYNQFGLLGMNNNQNGFSALFGGFGGLNNNNLLPGQGATQGGDPPPGVLLSVNYANMFLPNQQQINGGGGFGGFGGFPGFGFGGFPGAGFGFGGFPGFGFGYPFGKSAFGNGAAGL